ncbi:hypothetical protein NDU88_002499 [Pleurodeles waltl]|uniref:Uncharacterized protein n=1 Tax=Pleurodeles waltl TaxID=8319 RepID=A0AAV7SEW3_PLEWA|nr:hypothetical protein NDU88_002499 [Pleurodeles waltl]
MEREDHMAAPQTSWSSTPDQSDQEAFKYCGEWAPIPPRTTIARARGAEEITDPMKQVEKEVQLAQPDRPKETKKKQRPKDPKTKKKGEKHPVYRERKSPSG